MNQYDEISNVYETLHLPENWYNRKSVQRKKIRLINQIGHSGDIQHIISLMRFLLHENHELRNSTLLAINTLFSGLDSAKTYETSLRHCNIQPDDVLRYAEYFDRNALITPLAIASLNQSGYVREAAMREALRLNLQEELFPFIIYRLGDWVSEVRKSAELSFRKVVDDGQWLVLLDNLKLIFWLKKVSRVDLSDIFQDALDYLVVSRTKEVFSKFSTLPEKTRFQLCGYVLQKESVESMVFETLLVDKSYLVRSKLAEYIAENRLPDWMIGRLQKDKSSTVRQRCLESRMKNSKFKDSIDYKPFLFDKSAYIRNLAQHELRATSIEIAKMYREALRNGENHVGSIYGLGDVGGDEDIPLLMNFIDEDSLEVRLAAVRTILKISPSRLRDYLIGALDSEQKSIRKIAVRHLSLSADSETIHRVRRLYKNGDTDLKLSMLSFFNQHNEYSTLTDLILALGSREGSIVRMAWRYLSRWERNAYAKFHAPNATEKMRLQQVYATIDASVKIPVDKMDFWSRLPYLCRFE